MCAVFTELIPSYGVEGRKSRKEYVNNFISVLSRCNFEFSDTVEGMGYLCTYSRNKNDWHCYMQVFFFFSSSACFYSCLLTLLPSLEKGIPSFNSLSLLLNNEMSRNFRDCHGREKESDVVSIYYKSPILP